MPTRNDGTGGRPAYCVTSAAAPPSPATAGARPLTIRQLERAAADGDRDALECLDAMDHR